MPVEWVVWDRDFQSKPASLIGGKAEGLGLIVGLGLPVSPSFCVSTAALRAAVGPAVPKEAPELARHLRTLELSGRLRDEIRQALQELRMRCPASSGGFAVRSSFVSEDAVHARSPGVYRTEIGLVSDAEVLEGLQRVWASAFSPAAVDYRKGKGLLVLEFGMAVIVQVAVRARAGGIAYTLLPETADPSAILLEYAAGPPANVIDNRVTPDRLVLRKSELRSPAGSPDPDDAGLIPKAELRQLAGWALQLERALNAPVDVEWMLTDAGQLQLLQVRELRYSRPAEHASGEPGGYTSEAKGTRLRSEKLRPFRLRERIDLHTVDAHLILPAAFEAFKANGNKLTELLERACREVFEIYCRRGPVSIRSTFWSALQLSDMLPQSPRLLTVENCLEFVQSYWTYVIDRGLDDYSAEVALLVANWTPLRASAIATVSRRDGADKVLITALYGQMEGLETCTHDVYEVDLLSLKVERSSVPSKRLAVLTPRRGPESLPAELRDQPVLTAEEIQAVVRDTRAVAAVFGPVRVEFLVLSPARKVSEQRVVTWQIAPLSETVGGMLYYTLRVADAAPDTAGTISGRLFRLRDPSDTRRLADHSCGDEIVLIDLSRFEMRDPELATSIALALRDAGRPVLLKGSLLSHFAALLRDHQLRVLPINEPYDRIRDGEWVAVSEA